jgi:cell division septation protein DedD
VYDEIMGINMKFVFRFFWVCVILFVLPVVFVAAQEEPEDNAELLRIEISPEPLFEFGQEPVPEIIATPFEPDRVPELLKPEPQPPVRTIIPSYEQKQAESVQPERRPEPQVRYTMNVIPPISNIKKGKTYRLQLGSYSNAAIAQNCFDRIKNAGFSPAIERFGSLYRVVIPNVKSDDIQSYIQRLENAGFTEAWLREEN